MRDILYNKKQLGFSSVGSILLQHGYIVYFVREVVGKSWDLWSHINILIICARI